MIEIGIPELNFITNIPSICLLYFFYGLAFFFLGASIAVKDMKGSELKLAGCLWMLAGFGFTHGSHEWLELYLLLQGRYISMTEILYIKFVTVLSVVLSFVLLLAFGIKLISAVSNNKWAKWLKAVPAVLFIIWVIHLWKYGFTMDIPFFEMADMRARNTFGLIGGLMTAYGLIVYSKEVKTLSLPISKNLYYAGIVFIVYAILAGLVSSYAIFSWIPLRIEVFRSIAAVLIACFIIKALNIFDIETRGKLERQLELAAQSDKLASLGQLAAGIAHEINNPLTNASLNVETLKGKLKSCCGYDDILNKIDAIGRNIDKASAIAKELLQFSSSRKTEFVDVNINNVIASAITLLKYKLSSVSVHQDLTEAPDITGDPVKLEEVLINILNNSVEAMPSGGDIFISTSHDDDIVTIKVSDTGMGMPEEHIRKVFDPFFTTKEIGEGTGLGLSISYSIINQHNGTIDIASAEGKGTTVTIKLPVIKNEENSHS